MKMICSWRHKRKKAPNSIRVKKIIAQIAKLADLKIPDDKILSVNFVGPRTMRKINKSFLQHDYLTDVICFDYSKDEDFEYNDTAVEIFISPDIAEERVEDNCGLNYSDELLLYLIHAILHATGLKDKEENDKKRMRAAEKKIMTNLQDTENLFPTK